MEKSLNSLEVAFKRIRTGRANPSLLEEIKVDYYGTKTPLSQVANISVEDAKTIGIVPWEKNIVQDIEKAILESDLGINPTTSGETVRVILPDLTEETRKELIKRARLEAENKRSQLEMLEERVIHSLKSFSKKKRYQRMKRGKESKRFKN